MVYDITADCYLSLARAQVWIPARVCEQVASDLGSGFRQSLVSSPTYNWLVTT